MKRNMMMILAILLALLLCFGGLAVAGPPDHAGGPGRSVGPPGHSGSSTNDEGETNTTEEGENLPPGLQGKDTPPGLQDKGIPPGLQDKGGLPPGLQGRDTLPPGIQMRFAEALEEMETDPELVVRGEEYIVIPQENGDGEVDEEVEVNETYEYEAIFIDELDGEEKVEADWSITNDDVDEGVTFEDGTLEVTPQAKEGSITINADYTREDESFSNSLEVTLYSPEASSVEIIGPEYVALTEEDEESLTLEYEGVVLDQEGRDMDKEVDLFLELDDKWEDYITMENGTVSLVVFSEEEEVVQFTLKAEFGEGEDKLENELLVTVYYPSPDWVLVTGDKEVTLPGEDEEAVEVEYQAVVMDQLDQEMEEGPMVWFLVDEDEEPVDVEGVSLEDGTLRVTEEAQGGSLWLLAIYAHDQDVFGGLGVELVE